MGVGAILLIVVVITVVNLQFSIRRARDAQRRADLGAISNALESFQTDFGFFPPSENGLIKACRADNFDEVYQNVLQKEDRNIEDIFTGMRGCVWGEDRIDDLGLFGETPTVYISKLPQDPKEDEGIEYLYFSNNRRYQIFAHLEGGDSEEGFDQGIVDRQLMCGNKVCSFGKSFSNTPLDITLEEYEALLEEERMKRGTN